MLIKSTLPAIDLLRHLATPPDSQLSTPALFPKNLRHFNGRLNAAVESDIVGYQTIELTQKFNLMGINFSSIDGSNTVNVADLFVGEFTEGDQIQIRDGAGYEYCVWQNGMWVNKGGSVETTRTVERGSGVWLVLQGATKSTPVSVTVSGSVDLLSSLETELAQGFVIVSPGYPIEIPVNSPKFTWENFQNGDELQIRDGAGYNYCIWTNGVWVNKGGSVPSERVIPQGEAFWIRSASANTKVTMDPTK